MNLDAWSGIAQTILEGFDKHYSLFRQYSRLGKTCFERAEWQQASEASLERIQGYERRVQETVETILERFPDVASRADSWPRIKITFIGKLMNHLQAECAETFYRGGTRRPQGRE